jgi:hypothetical protein
VKIVCAWCRRVLQDGPGPISHGICRECAGQYREYYPSDKPDRDSRRFVDIGCWLLVLITALLAVGIALWRCL